MRAQKIYFLFLLCATHVYTAIIPVTTNADALVAPAGSLREALELAGAMDTINCTPISGQTISLAGPLPPIHLNGITILGPIIIDGVGAYQALPVASGTNITLSGLTIQNTNSMGGAGGSGFSGAGGGVGGGGALYIHQGASVTATNCQFSSNKASGGTGGVGIVSGGASGGGGGGFGGGNGGTAGPTVAGGGGGGHAGGGAGGFSGTPAGSNSTVIDSYSGGGGGATGGAGGFGGAPGPAFMGGAAGANGGGGGGGSGAVGQAAGAGGGQGGDGISATTSYGTGGGGGGASSRNGGPGFNTSTGSGGGGGGGDGASTGGQGGRFGGGGGGGATTGGPGGVGGGGGAGTVGGSSTFGGGSGASVPAPSTTGGGGGGGGAGLGGAVFVQQGGTLIINESTAGSFALQSNSTVAGAGGTGGTSGAAGKSLGEDFFLVSGGSLTIGLLENYTIPTNIESDQGAGGGYTATSGLTVTMAPTTTLTLSGVNTYTGTTTITSGILLVNADTGLGATGPGVTPTSITFPIGSTGTLQAGGTITSARGIILNGPGILDTPTGTSLSFSGTVSGVGKITKTSPGSLKLSGSNSYGGGTDVQGGTLIIGGSSNSPLGTGTVNLFDATTLQVASDYTGAGSINNALVFFGTQNGQTAINAQGNAKWSGVVSGTAPFNKTGPGTFTLTNGANSFTGNININGGTLGATVNGALGNTANQIFINSATFQAAGTFSTPRSITLTGSSHIEVLPTFTLTSTGIISGTGSLTKTNTGTLLLQPSSANLYLGGTTIAAGVLQIFSDSALGTSSSTLTIQTGTLQAMAGFTSSRPVVINGAAVIDTQAFPLTLSGVMSGSGSVEKKGSGTLILTGTNTYNGSFIITAGTLQGSSLSILGNVQDNGTLIFDQPSDGTYSGTLSQNGVFIKQGPGKVTFSGNSSGFQGPIAINAGTLNVTGQLGGSNTITVGSGGTLSGTGQVANVVVMNGANISPGNPTGILTITGNLNVMSGSTFDANISPTTGGLASVGGTATISNGSSVRVIPATSTSGFYGVSATYVILRAPTISGTFGSVTSTNPNFIPSLSYQTVSGLPSVLLKVIVTEPFLGFVAGNRNEQAVANNINALGASGTLLTDTPLFNALETLTGQTTDVINDALNQLHPAQFSALAEMQNETSAQLLNLFHRRPGPSCYCANPVRFWIEPYGSWLQEKPRTLQIGFKSRTQGIAIGFDGRVLDQLVLGIGGAWDYNHLSWAKSRGKANGGGLYGGVYLDYTTDHYYFGFSCLGGINGFHAERHIQFKTVANTNPDEVIAPTDAQTPVNEKALSNFDQLNIVSQFATAFMFGPSKCCFFPYLNADVMYADTREIRERNAPGLNLIVDPTSSMTFRGETGIGLQVEDTNYRETFCISPQVLLGYACETAIYREKYTSRFQGQSIPFRVQGWEQTWQILTVDFGLKFSYYCYNFSGNYHIELQPDSRSRLFNQRCSARFGITW